MSVVAFWAGIAWGILLWIFKIWLGIFGVLLAACVAAGWYRRLRRHLARRQARKALASAREPRLTLEEELAAMVAEYGSKEGPA